VGGFFLGKNFLGSEQAEAETQNKMYREKVEIRVDKKFEYREPLITCHFIGGSY
jgi:hypothetical protein